MSGLFGGGNRDSPWATAEAECPRLSRTLQRPEHGAMRRWTLEGSTAYGRTDPAASGYRGSHADEVVTVSKATALHARSHFKEGGAGGGHFPQA